MKQSSKRRKAGPTDPASLSVAELDLVIAPLAAELTKLKRIRRAKVAGLNSRGRPRTKRVPYEEVLAIYRKEDREGKKAVERTAVRVRLSLRQVYRIIKATR